MFSGKRNRKMVFLLCVSWSSCLRENDFWQTEHENGFSPVCIFLCSFTDHFCVNVLWQISQENGLLLVCDLLCFTRLHFCANDMRQRSHENGLVPLWISFMCLSRLHLCENDFWQMLQENGFSAVCILLCLSIFRVSVHNIHISLTFPSRLKAGIHLVPNWITNSLTSLGLWVYAVLLWRHSIYTKSQGL